MNKKSFSFILLIFLTALSVLTTNGCYGVIIQNTFADSEIKSTEIKIGILNSNQSPQFEATLLKDFINSYAFKYEIKNYSSYNSIIEDYNNHRIDIAITNTSLYHFKSKALYGPSIQDIKIALYCRNANVNRLYIPAQYSFIESEFFKLFPQYKDYSTRVDADFKTILSESFQNKNTCFFSEFNLETDKKALSKNFKPSWISHMSYPTTWFIQPNKPDINDLVHLWFQNLVRQNKIMLLREQYEFQFFNMTTHNYEKFRTDIRETLPQWKSIFQDSARTHQISWTLLAAVAYQESKWNNSAQSPTGVRGFMQITTKTAEHLGIKNRLDPIESIQGGAYYLKYLFDRTPTHITDQQRWIQALAAYNMGSAHIRELHKLAKEKNLNPFEWNDFKLLLLEKENEDLEESFEYGLARGKETINFIQKVFLYQESLNRIFNKEITKKF